MFLRVLCVCLKNRSSFDIGYLKSVICMHVVRVCQNIIIYLQSKCHVLVCMNIITCTFCNLEMKSQHVMILFRLIACF